jgi:hypothetical protein
MKENEAPEKIYIPTILAANTVRYKEEGSIEYIRKDTFIEKTCVKLKKLMYDNLMFQGRLHQEEIIEKFVGELRKYMKGE